MTLAQKLSLLAPERGLDSIITDLIWLESASTAEELSFVRVRLCDVYMLSRDAVRRVLDSGARLCALDDLLSWMATP